MASITSNPVSRRRPPAIEPQRKSVRVDPPAEATTPQVAAAARNESPLVVLRLPEIAPAPVTIPFKSVAQPAAAPKNEQFKLIAVAGGLVLLAAALFSGGAKRPATPIEPANPPALTPPAASPSDGQAPPWQGPVVSLPPIGEQPVREEYPSYRTADRTTTLGEAARRDSALETRPSVRFEGSIEKQTPDFRYERP
jgi:hypothetical protein